MTKPRRSVELTPAGTPTALLEPPADSTDSMDSLPSRKRDPGSILPSPSVPRNGHLHNGHYPPAKKSRPAATARPAKRFPAVHLEEESANRQAELFYLQKQIQLQTQMIFVLEDGERLQGIIEWYDRHSIKLRGKSRTLIYKAGIKYLYKAGETGMDSDS